MCRQFQYGSNPGRKNKQKMQMFDFMLLWAINMNGFWPKLFQQWYTKIGTFIPYRLGHGKHILGTCQWSVHILDMFKFNHAPNHPLCLVMHCLALGRAPALQLRQIVLCQGFAAGAASRQGFDPYPKKSAQSSPDWTSFQFINSRKKHRTL